MPSCEHGMMQFNVLGSTVTGHTHWGKKAVWFTINEIRLTM
jgi:hypothetical protein